MTDKPVQTRPAQRWTIAEDELLYDLRKAGKDFHEIGAAVGRSMYAAEARWKWLHMTDEQREYRNKKEYLRRHQNTTHKPRPYRRRVQDEPVRIQYPDHVFVDRAARQMAPQTLTGFLCGDPPPGWSALDRRAQA